MWKEFKAFAMKGNVIDLAVGIIIGAAFGTIVRSLVDDIIMPPIGYLLGNVDFSNLFVTIKEGAKAAGPYETLQAARDAGAVTVNYGVFVNNIVSFLIVSFSVFMLVKVISMLKKKDETIPPQEPTTKDCPYCYSKISIKATRCPECTSELKAAI
jgi:large conductance mechanosensitive channel